LGPQNPHPIKKEKDRKERLKGHGPEHVYNTLGYIGMKFDCFRYDFSVALLSALALLKYDNLRLTVEV